MPSPKDVNPSNFKVKKVLFDNDSFSIAYGMWQGQDSVIAMRWNGDNENDMGYPKTFGNPMWFIVHDDLKEMIIKGLVDLNPSILLENT
ncbi:hypothetical protein [Thiomicrospira sp. S5]|uniref:hypothetical protein n=1 Tax=Thiomicrospira sp. S5 TaxID=1803865 RepID=UPI0004A729A6|nr:hypothetical protein [Thiomicrospira sp. S5]AZR82345.1 hypothetical protein AYJ59_08640 [Thiomicrospira sp. S5]